MWNPFAKKAPEAETKSLTSAASWWELITGAAPTAAGITVTASEAMRVPVVANAVQLISEAVASLDVFVKRIEGGTETDDEAHQLLPLLRDEVNGWTSSFEFFRQIVIDALTLDQGGMALVVRADDGRPLEIIRYTPGILVVDIDQTTGERTYKLNAQTIPAQNVIHLLSPLGRAPLTLAREAIAVAVALERHAARLFTNGARPSGALMMPAKLGEDAVKRIISAWRATHEGSGKDGRTAVLYDGATFTPFAFSSTDAQFLENRRFQIEELARIFNIPAPMVGDLSRATWSNSEQKGREFLSYTLEPWLRGLEGALRRALFLPEERGSHVIRFDRDDLTRADLATRATVINSLIASRTINNNEGRQWLGLPPREGGDEFLNPNISQGNQETGKENPNPKQEHPEPGKEKAHEPE
ncbi:phage portal protein [Xinfangfangia sp. D13-10-4-6]|uniref:phage portal protein n=1 Tax=Pseudogemmobacter hezensis TaxID=2737662 RepID=UPI001554A913|nr:phage portal protein [Pseudogemmobacter hezensis]NPD14475.1 phage portal protein [Pseudogemmobacter hezensis]